MAIATATPFSGLNSRYTDFLPPPSEEALSVSRTIPRSMSTFMYFTSAEELSLRISASSFRVTRLYRKIDLRMRLYRSFCIVDSTLNMRTAILLRYPFKAPADIPLIKSRCIVHMRMSTGKMTTQLIAAIGPHASPLSVMNPAMITVSGLAFEIVRMTA